MVVAPWIPLKLPEQKKLCLKCLGLNIHYEGLDYIELNNIVGCYMDDNNDFVCPIPDSELIKIVENMKKTKDPEKNLKSESKILNSDFKKNEKRGRPVKNGYMTRKAETNYMLRQKNADSFLLLDSTKNTPDILSNNDLYIDNLMETVEIIKNEFFADNPDLIKKHPSIWFRRLCLTIKQNSPRMDYNNNPDIISRVWDIYADLCVYIGINRTIENFQIFTGLKWDTIDKLKKASSPDYVTVAKKIYDSCKADIVGGLSSSFGSSPNQMFIAKSIYGIVENTVITHVSAVDSTKTINDIPMFIENKNENS